VFSLRMLPKLICVTVMGGEASSVANVAT
jgi:hypothetical protein